MILGLFALACIALSLFCMFDVNLSEPSTIRSGSQAGWSLVVLVPVLGPLTWFRLGRPQRAGLTPGSVRRASPRPLTAPSVRGPEDDPAFIQSLAERLRDSGES